ncbi:hypothetical protein ACH4M4_12255 [Streptomyces sp. NPDC017254]|uniref:hypothetical protein n=1 Tax=unclassified Streptomyces TaxID=2593676 RepID=UPI003795DFC2
MLTLNIILGLGCLTVFFLVISRSAGWKDVLLWAAVAVLVVGGIAPRLVGIAPGTAAAVVITAVSLAALAFVLAAITRRP